MRRHSVLVNEVFTIGIVYQLLKLLGRSFLTYQVSVIYRFHNQATISETGLAVFENSR